TCHHSVLLSVLVVFTTLIVFTTLSFMPFRAAYAADRAPTNIYVFGDSLSDNGNLSTWFQLLMLGTGNYNGERMTNGLTAIEVMSRYMGVELRPARWFFGFPQGSNYAAAGATASGTRFFDLERQVDAYLKHYREGAKEDSLFVIFIGSNDLRSAISRSDRSMETMIAAAQGVYKQTQRLISNGAKQILWINAPNTDRTPELWDYRADLEEKTEELLVKQMTALIKIYNESLSFRSRQIQAFFDARDKRAIEAGEAPLGRRILVANLYKLVETVLDEPQRFGFKEVKKSCMSVVKCRRNEREAAGYLYYDQMHPSGAANEMLGKFLYDFYMEYF
ncbi:MAG: SGNH/GDSL hydrolase family protein, partial [Gammaproteobacteria bacterium]